MPSIKDVAKAAGVSTATVSRSLSGANGVTDDTRARVQQMATVIGYERKGRIRNGSGVVGRALGLIVPDLLNPFYSSLVKGIERRARSNDLLSVVANTEEDALRERQLLEQFADIVEGIVVASPRGNSETLQALSLRTKVVLINREVEGVASIVSDLFDGTQQLLQHVVSLGHRRIGYAGGPPTSWSDHTRRQALKQMPESFGIGVPEVVDLGAFRLTHGGGVAAADAGLAARVSVIIAFNDHLAMGILSRLIERKVSVPEEMSLTGFDDIPVARLLAPSLTTVSVPAIAIGERTVEMLMNGREVEACERVRVPGELVVRVSTAPFNG